MSYDELTSEIDKLRSKLKQRSSHFSKAQSNIKELEKLATNFEDKQIKYDKKEYKKAVSALESGEYEKAVALTELAKKSTQGSISEMEKVDELKQRLIAKIDDFNAVHTISFPESEVKEIDKLIAKGDFKAASEKIDEVNEELDSIVEAKETAQKKFNLVSLKVKESSAHILSNNYESAINNIQELFDNNDFANAITEADNLESTISTALNAEPELQFGFPQGLVAQEWNKVSLEINNSGSINVKNVQLDFDGLRQRESFFFGDIDVDSTGSVVGSLLPEDPGSLEVKVKIVYQTHKGEKSIDLEEWLDIARPGTVQPEVSPAIKVSKTAPAATAKHRSEVPDWRKPSGLSGDEATLLELFEKRWECYSKWPKNKPQLDYLHNNHEKFAVESYFEIPTDPSTVLNEWALPDNLRRNVYLDKQRESHIMQILAAPLETNFVIIGEPGVGKTTLLYEVFDSFMDKVPVGILTTSSIANSHIGFGCRLFYDDIPENLELVQSISENGAKGLVISAREADWNRLPADMQKQFQRLSVPLFLDEDIAMLCHKMLDFSNIRYDDAAIEQLTTYSQGSPIFVWSLIREMLFGGVRLLTNTYVKDNSRKGMESYVSLILQKLLKDGTDYKSGGLHALGCMVFLSEYMKDRKCHEILFRSFAETVEGDFEDVFDDRQSTNTFNQTIAYLSGEGALIRFPHDTWADVLEGMGRMNPFRADIQTIKRKIAEDNYEKYKRIAVTDAWEQTVRRFRRNSVREKDSFLALSDILTNNFTLSELEKDLDDNGRPDVDIEMMREVCSSNADLPIAARVLSRIQSAKPTQFTKIINIKDTVINRSNLNFEGDENIEDSVINKE